MSFEGFPHQGPNPQTIPEIRAVSYQPFWALRKLKLEADQWDIYLLRQASSGVRRVGRPFGNERFPRSHYEQSPALATLNVVTLPTLSIDPLFLVGRLASLASSGSLVLGLHWTRC